MLNKSFSSINFFLLLIMCFTFIPVGISAQRIVDKNKGDHNATKKGWMDGNLVGTVYYNFGEIADWENEPDRSGVWPIGTNHTYVDGIAIIVQAEATDPQGNIIHPLETNYYEYTRYDPQTGVTYGWWPLPGYANPYNSSPARSDDDFTGEITWPNHWPDRTSDWDGYWNGFFGKGVKNADLETYFVFDDHEDREYLLRNNFHPDDEDLDRGGLGMQVKARGFQWSQVLAADVIFWYYEITNMGTYDYEKTLFAQYIDWGIGGHNNSSNNAGDYNELLDISYAYSTVPYGSPGNWSPVGLAGYAFLESPGISSDRRDNDTDGLTDERRDNDATFFIDNPNQDPFMLNPFQDTATFAGFYEYEWQPHWDADENANWTTYFDLNENGQWDTGEPLYDDVGTDGIGPFNEGYLGPDPDGTEANGRPDQGEPDFGFLDKDESDQLGLTGFLIFPVHVPYDLNKDELNWEALSSLPTPHGQTLLGVNLANYFSCYLFHMYGRTTYSMEVGEFQETGETERFSMALLYGINKTDLFRRKKTIQQIYNAHYRFAKPPHKPIVKAIAGDQKVTLYWDNRAELTFDAFYQTYNFEGYKILRATDPNFLENKVITDAYGKTTFSLPIAQFDLADGVQGIHPIDVNGASYYLGDDSGLKHSYIDTEVQNGQTYYYAVIAYDKGYTSTQITGALEGISPAETSAIIKTDINGNYITDINTAVVTPKAPAAGYIAPEITNLTASGPGTGEFSITVLDPDSVKNFHSYRIEFKEDMIFHNDPAPYYRLIDYTVGDTLIDLTRFNGPLMQTGVIDGFTVEVTNDTAIAVDSENTRWIEGNSNFIVQVGFDDTYAGGYERYRIDMPADFEIELTEPGQGDMSFPSTTFSQPEQSNIIIRDLTNDIDHVQFIFRDVEGDGIFGDQDVLFLAFGDSLGKRATDFDDLKVSWSVKLVQDTALAPEDQRPPQFGDIYKLVVSKPFRDGEYFEFTTIEQSFDAQLASNELDDIAVVPNPYVGAASWEPYSLSVGRGERRIYFMHLPHQCTIRIYTLSGKHVKTIEHDSHYADGQESWNLVSKDGMDIAYGVYVFHVDAPGVGEKIDKFAIIK
ncbi:hypothetical protein ACFLTH_08850 [Bacteroidota bacterium]